MKLVYNWSRNTPGGIAGVNGSGYVIDPNGDVLQPNAANGYAKLDGSSKYAGLASTDTAEKQTNKDANSGYAALDANGNVLGKGAQIQLTRDGSNIIYFSDRTSTELPFRCTRTGTQAWKLSAVLGGNVQLLGVLDVNGDIPHMRPKAASANLRHSFDTVLGVRAAAYTKIKTFTFANGISGTIRCSWDMLVENGTDTVYGRIYKNGVAIGADIHFTTSNTYVTFTEDINFGVCAPGDTIELWMYTVADTDADTRNFRLSYDNAADTIAVAGVTTS